MHDGPPTRCRQRRRAALAADAVLDDVLAAARAPGGRGTVGRHSALYEWLWAHFDRLGTELTPPRRPNWHAVAAALATRIAGGDTAVLDGAGKAPGPETIRQTWWRVRKDRRAARVPQLRASAGEPPHACPAGGRDNPAEAAVPARSGPPPAPRFGTGARPRAAAAASETSEE